MLRSAHDLPVSILSCENNTCVLDRIGNFAVSVDFSTRRRIFTVEGARNTLHLTLETDASDNRVKLHGNRDEWNATFFVISGTKTVYYLETDYWAPPVTPNFVFCISTSSPLDCISPVKLAVGETYGAVVSPGHVDRQLAAAFNRSTELFQAIDSAVVVSGSTEFVSLVALCGTEIKFAMRWFSEETARRYKHTMRAGLKVETDFTESGLDCLRRTLTWTQVPERSRYDDDVIIEAAKAAHCFDLIDSSIGLLASLSMLKLATAMSDIPFSVDPRFSSLVPRIVSYIGDNVSANLTFSGTSLAAIVEAIEAKHTQEGAVDGCSTADDDDVSTQPAKRARTESGD